MAHSKAGIWTRNRLALHPLFRDLVLTGGTQLSVLLAGLFVISLFGRLLGPVILGEYLLLRRVVAWLQSGAQAGLVVALPRYVAHAVGAREGERASYFYAASATLGVLSIVLGLALMLGRKLFSQWLFGSTQMAHLILPLSVMILGSAAHVAVYGYYRGCLAMRRANILQFLNLSLAPILAVTALYQTRSVVLIVCAMGGASVVASALLAVPIVQLSAKVRPLVSYKHARELLRYGIARVPGDFAGSALLALGPVIAAHYLPLGQVSGLLLGLSMLMAISISVTPLGLVLLSKVSSMLAQNREAEVRNRLALLLAAVVEFSLFACWQIVIFADVLVRYWVGRRYLAGVTVVRIVLLSIPSYLFYAALRSVIDAASVKAYNARNVLSALAGFLVLTGLAVRFAPANLLLEAIAMALFVGLGLLAWMTALSVEQLCDLRMKWGKSAFPILLGIALGGCSFLVHWSSNFRTGVVQMGVVELAVITLFFAILVKCHSPWIDFLWNTAFKRTKMPEVTLTEA